MGFFEQVRPRGTVIAGVNGPTGDSDIEYDSEELEAAARAARKA
jgi:hypothetical protein